MAAIRGYCLGGGLDLPVACHLRVAATGVVFGHPGSSLGTIPGWGGTARLPRLIGRARAVELLVTGQTITAEQAYAWRLVRRVVPPDESVACALETVEISWTNKNLWNPHR